MANTIDYLNWRGDLSFASSPINEIDVFICSQLSTPDYQGIVAPDSDGVLISNVVEEFFKTHKDSVATLGVLQSEYVLPMLKILPKTERYKDIKISGAINKVDFKAEKQFAAITIEMPDDSICVAYRGTDDTIVGWKEDFHLATMDEIPAQTEALKYLNEVGQKYEGKTIRVCGHSKGGNLAVYAATFACENVRQRIVDVYSFDGPGFEIEFFNKSQYKEIENKVKTVVSQNSLVGMLLYLAGSRIIVKSNKSGAIAHDGFTWEVVGTKFVRCERLSNTSQAFNKAMNSTLAAMNSERRNAFVDELFDSLSSTGALTITDIKSSNVIKLVEILKAFQDDKLVQEFTQNVLNSMMKSSLEKTIKFDGGEIEKIVSDQKEMISLSFNKAKEFFRKD